jgi:hypothetical protein
MQPKKTFSTALGLGAVLSLGLLFADIAPAAAAPPAHARAYGYRRNQRTRRMYRPASTIWPRTTRTRRGMRDRDGDGIRNRWDRDRDNDGIRNRWDRDRDNDGVRNRRDRYPNNPNRGTRDRDRDGIRNRMDRDRDNDGVPNRRDRYPNNPRRR